MTTPLTRIATKDLVFAGVAAGLIFAAFEIVATALVDGRAAAMMPLRMIGGIILGRSALDSTAPLAFVAVTSVAVHLLLSVVYASIFAAIVTRIASATDGELMTSSGQVALAGGMFGTVLWLINFYVIAPLAGWTWFPANVHHVIAFLGHAFFFGCPLGWIVGRSTRELPLAAR
jgi:hypothetical protein